MVEQLDQTPFNLVALMTCPTGRPFVHVHPTALDHVYQQALSQPMLAHHPGRHLRPVSAQREAPIGTDRQLAVALHPRHRLRNRWSALPEALGRSWPAAESSSSNSKMVRRYISPGSISWLTGVSHCRHGPAGAEAARCCGLIIYNDR